MLSLFRTNQIIFSFLLIFYLVLLRLSLWFGLPEVAEPVGSGALARQWWPLLNPAQSWLGPVLAMGLLFVQGWLANVFTARHRLGPDINLFPGLMLVLSASASPALLGLSGYHFANVFLILSIFSLSNTYKVAQAADDLFNAGFLLGVAALFQANYLWFVVAALGAMGVLRARRFREILMLVSGVLTPLVLVGFSYYWFDEWALYWQWQFAEPFGRPMLSYALLTDGSWITLLLPLFLLLLALLRYSRYGYKMTIEVQKNVDVLYWFMFAAGLSLLTLQHWSANHFLTVVFPVGVLLGLQFSYWSARVAESVHLVLWVLVLMLQIWPLLS